MTAWVSNSNQHPAPFMAASKHPFPVDSVSQLAALTPASGVMIETTGYSSKGDGGHGVYLAMTAAEYGITPDEQGAAFTAANGNVWVLQPYNGQYRGEQFGCDGVTDDAAAISAAISRVNALGGGEIVVSKLALNSQITILNKVTLNLLNGIIKPLSDVDLVAVRPGGKLKNFYFDNRVATTGVAYTKDVAKLVPTSNTQGRMYQEWLQNGVILLDAGAGNGAGVAIDASTYYVMEMRASNVVVWRGQEGVKLIAGTTGQWITHCTFANFHLTDNVYHVYTEEDVSGNVWVGGATEKNTYGSFHISGGGNQFLMTIQDGPAVTIARDANDGCDANYFNHVSGTDMPQLSDGGHNTRIVGRGFEYFDGLMIRGYRNDARANIQSGGRQEFIDMMLCGPDPRWTQSTTGTGTIVAGSGQFGIAAGFEQNLAYTQLTLAADNDTAKLDFNGVKPWATGRNPTLHLTVGEASVNALVEAGFYGDANNYVLIKFDGTGTAAGTGSGKWAVETCVGGVKTTQVIAASAGTNRINLFTLKVTDTSVKIWYGEWNIANGGSSGQLSKWAQAIESTDPEYEITTNIPAQVAMEQRIYAEADGGSASCKVFDVQYKGSRKEYR